MTLSNVLNRISGLEQNRGIRFIGENLQTRDRSRGLEWNQIGRLLHETDAVRLVEASIDSELGPGQGRKLLKEMGGVYRWYGGARITPEQARKALLQAEALSGQPIKFSLSPRETHDVRDAIRKNFKTPRQLEPQRLDSAFEVDSPRLGIVLAENGHVVCDIREEMHKVGLDKASDEKKLQFVIEKLKGFIKEDGDETETISKRLLYTSTLLNQNSILSSAFPKVIRYTGGTPVPVPRESRTIIILNKTRDENGLAHFDVHIQHVKKKLQLLDRDGGQDVIELAKDSSFFLLNQQLEISSDDLANGNGDGLIIHPPEVIVQMTRADRDCENAA
jgi:hypothetical protein